MNANPQKQARNSRWSRDPVVGRDGAAVAVYPTERDIEIFKLLVRFRYLPSDYIHAFVGGNEKALSRRLNLLARKPNLYLARPISNGRTPMPTIAVLSTSSTSAAPASCASAASRFFPRATTTTLPTS